MADDYPGPTNENPTLKSVLLTLSSTTPLVTTPLPANSVLGGIPISTFGELLTQLRSQHPGVSVGEFQEQSIAGATLCREMERPNTLLAGPENGVCADAQGPKGSSEIPENGNGLPNSNNVRKRDRVAEDQAYIKSARERIPELYPHYGQALVEQYRAKSALAALITLWNSYGNEMDAIGAINRATLNRVKNARNSKKGFRGTLGQRIAPSATPGDLRSAVKLDMQTLTAPTLLEIHAENICVDRMLGTLTSDWQRSDPEPWTVLTGPVASTSTSF
ncbi:uncharacterized protein APUU_80942A [Aspergillus puulaauensis]|uniref:Uncharacterized protein n=1 Tax=Aspergillus puulaauensis TaxID=1220207 RepID=A0A7R8ASQ6_9EURO|nr:uncharacterized protein APUU_80942A [Aspergillus puulaauensis]BCS30639.1 hypothetical protein APUU_80942A [Aspergillus puulaauensis]